MSLPPLLLTISSNRANICSFAPTSQESQSTRKKLIMMMMFSFNHLFMDNSSLSHLQRIMKWLLISDDVTEASFHQCWDEDKALITFKRITLMAFFPFCESLFRLFIELDNRFNLAGLLDLICFLLLNHQTEEALLFSSQQPQV